jgi:hypothetical protein
MIEYEVNGKVIKVRPEHEQQFLEKYPNAIKVEGKTQGAAQDATATLETTASASQSETTSSGLKNLYKNLETSKAEAQRLKESLESRKYKEELDNIKSSMDNAKAFNNEALYNSLAEQYNKTLNNYKQDVDNYNKAYKSYDKLYKKEKLNYEEDLKRFREKREAYRQKGYDVIDESGTPNALMPDGLKEWAFELVGNYGKSLQGIFENISGVNDAIVEGMLEGKTRQEVLAKAARGESEDLGQLTANFSLAFDEVLGYNNRLTDKKYDEETNEELDVTGLIERGRMLDAGDLAATQAFGSIMSFVASGINPIAGATFIATSSYGSEMKEGLKRFEGKEFSQEDVATIRKAAFLKSGAEFGGEVLGGYLFRRASGLIKSGATKEVVKEFNRGFLNRGLRGFGGGFAGEFLAEGLTSVMQDSVDELVYGDEKTLKDYIRNSINSGLVGGLLGGGISGGMRSINRATKKEIQQLLAGKKWQSDYVILQQQLVKANKAKQESDDDMKPYHQKRIDLIKSKIEAQDKLLESSFDNMTEKDLEDYASTVDKINEERNVAFDGSVDIDVRDEAKENILKLYNKLNSYTDGFINVDIENRIGDILKAREILDKRKGIRGFGKDLKIKYLETSAEVNALGLKGFKGSDGVFLDGENKTIYINKEVASQTGNTNVLGHELLHYMMSKNFKTDNESMKPLIDSFKQYLSSSGQQDVLDRIEARMRNNGYFNEDGTIKEGNLEEYLNIFSDLIETDGIKLDNTKGNNLANSFKTLLIGLGFAKVELNDGKAVFDFIKAYNKNVNREGLLGEITKRRVTKTKLTSDKAAETEGVNTEVTKESRSDAKAAVDQLGRVDSDGQDMTEPGIGNFLYQAEVDQIIRTIKEEGYLDNLIAAKYKVRPVPPEFVDDVLAELTPHIKAFKPETNDSLFGWINSQIANKAGNVYNKIYKDKGPARTVDVDATTSEGAPVVQLEADTDTEIIRFEEMDLSKKEVQQRSKLRRDLKLDKPMITRIKQAVIKTFGTMLPDVQAKDFRAALQKAFRTELKKPIQDMMGGRTEYDSFLTNYFEAIYKALPVETLVQMERNLKPDKRIFTSSRRITKPSEVDKLISEGKLPKNTSRTSGPQLHTKKPSPSLDQVLAFFRGTDMDAVLGYKVGASTLGTRKDKLAMSLSEELAFDATSEVLQDPAVKAKRQGILELQGYDSKNDLTKVAEKIDRDPAIKFSKSMKNIADQSFSKLQKNLNVSFPVTFREAYIGKSGKEKYRNMMDWGRELRIGNALSTLEDHTRIVLEEFFKNNSQFVFDFRRSTTGGRGISTFGTTSVFDKLLGSIEIGKKLFNRFNYSVTGKLLGKDRIKKENGKLFFKEGNKFINEKQFVSSQDKKLDILESLFVAIQEHLNKNPEHAWFFFRAVGDSTNNQDHMVRVSAPLKGAPIDANNNLVHNQQIAEEHMFPQNEVGKILLHAAVTGASIADVMKVVRASYAQIALLETDDIKTRQAGYRSTMPDIFYDKVVPRIIDGSLKIADGLASIVRYTASGINLNNYTLFGMDMTITKYFGVNVDLTGKTQQQIDTIVEIQNELIDKQIIGELSKEQASKQVAQFSKSDLNVYKKASETRALAMKAEANLVKYSKSGKAKGMSTFDFDETLIIDGKNFIVATHPETGAQAKITSDQWPIQGPDFAAQGFEFDFSDFANVRGGKEGPLLQKMKNQIKKYGSKNVFVLTARQQDAAGPIHEWLKTQGINIPIKNITGLGKSEGSAKGEWMLQKFAEGYNDMYFVDDAMSNVKAVKQVLEQLDIKSKVVQAKVKFSKSASKDFNDMLERSKGIKADAEFSSVEAKLIGAKKGRFKFFVPPSAEDFKGLIYAFISKGEQGNKDLQWFKDNLFTPFAKGIRNLNSLKQRMTEEYSALKKKFPNVVKSLNDKVANTEFTVDNAIRVYLWNMAGFDVPGISDAQKKLLIDYVAKNAELVGFADVLSNITRTEEGYVKPTDYWIAQNIGADLKNVAENISRKKYLAEWQENIDLVFSEQNLNKIEAIYGSNFREALENMLYRMKTGNNRPSGRTSTENKFLNWINGSVGAVMFFNMRSALLQNLSMVNFLNFEDNNIFAAAKAFANQKQYWADFAELFNSDMLKQRRAGLKIDVSASELTDAFAQGKNKAEAVIKYLLEKGFLPTQLADSFAIASGGATFYRNRINKYIKQGMSQAEAQQQAFLDFQELAEETQQSSRPDLISMQQASSLGRIILAWANTPMQYTRLTKKALSNLINGRGDAKANVSRIIYYGAVQNIIFGSLQTGLAFLMFGDDEEDKDRDKKEERVLNGMLDTLLRGIGVYGALFSTAKNTLIRANEELGKGFGRKDYSKIMQELISLSPPIGSKVRKIMSAIKGYDFNKDIIDQMDHGINNPAWNIFANVIEGVTNAPVARIQNKLNNVREAFEGDHEMWQRIALVMGWQKWDLGIKDAEIEEARDKAKQQKKQDKKQSKVKKSRCVAIKSNGKRCKNMVSEGSLRCYVHD